MRITAHCGLCTCSLLAPLWVAAVFLVLSLSFSAMSAPTSASSSVAHARVSQIVSHLTAAAGEGSASSGPAPNAVSIVSREAGVAVIQINYPPVNSLHPRVQAGIAKCYEEAVADASIKAIVITGTKAVFMAGQQSTRTRIAA